MSNSIFSSARVAGALLCIALAGCSNDTANQQSSSSALPDWSGAWGTPRQTNIDSAAKLRETLKPEQLAKLTETRDKALSDDWDIRANYCVPAKFGGFNFGFRGSMEFLFNPGRVTLIWEGGMVRRIFTDGRALPADPEPTDAGTSVGHWEGQTLVVETVGMRPDAPALGVPGSTIGENARVTERFSLKDAETLQIDSTLEAPDVLTTPAKITYIYKRHPNYNMASFTACPEYDRSVDPETGRQRFDMTPPDDILPPPTE